MSFDDCRVIDHDHTEAAIRLFEHMSLTARVFTATNNRVVTFTSSVIVTVIKHDPTCPCLQLYAT